MLPNRTAWSLLFVCALAGWGCSSTTTIRRPASPAEAAQILAEPGSREVELAIESPNGPMGIRGVLAPFDANTFIVADRSGQRFSIPFQYTRSITYTSGPKGAGIGFLIGVVPGFVSGLVLGWKLSGICGDSSSCNNSASAPAWGLLAGSIGGLVTGAIGAAVGAIVGSKTTLTF